ncbi:MAG: TIGR02270 family protein, partial [Nitrococcus sp.]|nr:TIGR02270 family protein [Nitrococcus sp.]
PGDVLTESLQARDPLLRATALRVAGSLGRDDLLPVARAQLQNDDASVRFAAAWSAMLLGDRGAAPREALAFIGTDSPRRADMALKVALRALSLNEALQWLNHLARQPEALRHAVVACGIVGDPVCMPWLFEQMRIAEVSRVAGEAFAMITGVDLALEDLEGEWPEGFEAGPTENAEDEDVEMDSDEDLPWPDVRLIADWWSRNQNRFPSGTRYLMGKPVAAEHLQWVLRHGMQRQREAAALELKLLRSGVSLFETRAPGLRQQRVLGLKA